MPRCSDCRGFAVVVCLVTASCLHVTPMYGSAADTIPPNGKAIAEVQAGHVETARASLWGFDPADSTRSLQAALDSPAKTIRVEDMGSPWVVTTIQLPSDKEIVFESGVVIEAKRGEFLHTNACLFSAKGQENLTIRGEGAVFRMHKADYHQPPYKLAEWRHALSIRGCTNVVVEGLTLKDSGGDGIYLGVGSDGATNRDVKIRKVVCDGNNRQGISVITAENLLIEDCVFCNTEGTAPQAGIDFEPNKPSECLVNCVLRNCKSENNVGHAYHLYLGHLHQESKPISIRFENCSSKNCGRYSTYVGIANRSGLRTVRGTIEYVGCEFDGDEGAGVYIRGNEADGCRVRLEKCTILRRDEAKSALAPITIEAPRELDIEAGNIEILDCVIRDSTARCPIGLIASPITRVRKLSGSLTYFSPVGQRSYELDAQQLDEWFPNQGLIASIPRRAFDWRKAAVVAGDVPQDEQIATFRLRHEAALLVSGTGGQAVDLVAKLEPVGKHTPTPGVMTVTAADGKSATLKPEIGEDRVTLRYSFTPRASGPFRLLWKGDGKTTLRPVECSAPIALLAEKSGVNLVRPIGTLYFPVPGDVESFAILVAGAGTAETVQATIYDQAGRTVRTCDNIASPHVFVVQTPRSEKGTEIWSIMLEKATSGVLEDVSIQTVGIPSVLSASSQCVFSGR